MDDENRLITDALGGNDKAMRELAQKYMAFAGEKAKGFVSSSLEYDDIVQEAMMGFLSALYSYDANKGASFKTYCSTCMNNRIITAINRTKRKKQIPNEQLVRIDDLDEKTVDLTADPESVFFSNQQTNDILEKISSDLSSFEKEVFYLYFIGHSYEEIAQKLSCGFKSIDNAMQRIRKKLRAYV